ncbi:MAG: LytTR family transcriptional regulator DNA-binding domain-containing protein [Bacteroidaceae bacterium]|nr:LytTR family transcriptional regulator DNA-binding domain-containing protein [Bacteroidaceae bacterium]
MRETVIISNTNELVRMRAERIIYVQSDGNYSTFVLNDKTEQVFTMNLARCMEELERQLGREAQAFIRIGKSLIVNRRYIYRVNVQRQHLVMSDLTENQAFTLQASKEALRQLKALLEAEGRES